MKKKQTRSFILIKKDSKLLPDYVDFKPSYAKPLRIMFSAASVDTLFVLEAMLQLGPSRRCTCKEVNAFKNK